MIGVKFLLIEKECTRNIIFFCRIRSFLKEITTLEEFRLFRVMPVNILRIMHIFAKFEYLYVHCTQC